MNWITAVSENHRRKALLLLLGMLSLLMASPAPAKLATDFDPNLDFSRFKTFAFIGGFEQLLRMQLNPDQLNNQIHRAVTRELTSKGLQEVTPEQDPDLVTPITSRLFLLHRGSLTRPPPVLSQLPVRGSVNVS